MELDYDRLVALRKQSAAWRLLTASNAALMLSFFNKVFVEQGARSIAGAELVERLDDELFALNERLGQGTFPKSAKAYLDDWSALENGWLRKYYPPDSDEPHFDATAAVEKAISWIRSLEERSFVGTESRLNTIFDLLRQMTFGAETDPDARLAELTRRRHEIDQEIERVEAGEVDVLDSAGLRDRYQQVTATAYGLLADFREVEANFRDLDRDLRSKIAAWDGAKAELLDEVLGSRESIAESDQGRTFQAFYDFLLAPSRQDELKTLLAEVETMEAIGEPDPRMRRMPRDWLEAAERTQATVRQLSDQLRRFLDDQVRSEDRRVPRTSCRPAGSSRPGWRASWSSPSRRARVWDGGSWTGSSPAPPTRSASSRRARPSLWSPCTSCSVRKPRSGCRNCGRSRSGWRGGRSASSAGTTT
ncbi:DUF3375 domain-containing protein [Streptomyces sp. NBC_00445]|uniref:DUF3375 domain-containing protein n=1 Tax=Streptomyces sp. NBC_00445 TaxID=2975745 RepID=UPI002E1D667F